MTDDEFRVAVRDWLNDNLTDRFRAASTLGALTDDAHYDIRLEWERKLADAGWLGLTWPVEYGGAGRSNAQQLIFLMEHMRAGAPCWVGLQGRELFGPMLLEFGTEEQKKRFLPPIQAAEEFWGQGFSEPDAGSDLANVRTTARLDGDTWIIDGQKTWTSFGSYAQWIYALCRTEAGSSRHKGLSMLLIPVDQPGVEVRPIRHLAGGHDFCEVYFDGATTSVDLVVGGEGNGWAVAMGGLGTERFTTTLAYQTQFDRQFDALLATLRERGQLQGPVIRSQLADAWIGLRLNQIANDRLLDGLVSTGQVGPESSLAKLRWATWHREFSNTMVNLLGPSSLIVGDGYELDEFQNPFLNSRAETIYGGSNEIQKNVIGERILGLPR